MKSWREHLNPKVAQLINDARDTLKALRASQNCEDCGRLFPVCDEDLCFARAAHRCQHCKNTGPFHESHCPRRTP